MPAVFRGQIPEAIAEWATKVYNNAYRSREQANIFRKVNKVMQTERAYEEAWEVSGLGTFFLKVEGTSISYDVPVQGNRTRHTVQTYALGCRYTHEMMQDDRWQVMEGMTTDLAHSGRHHQEVLAHGPWNDAFTGTTYTGLDGQPLCSANHTRLKLGTVQSNLLSPAADLSTAALEAVYTMGDLWTDDSGRYIPFNPTLLFSHPNYRFETHRLLQSDKEPYTSENQDNAIKSSLTGTTPLRSPYLTDPDAWFLIDTGVAEVIYWDRESNNGAPIQRTGSDFNTMDVMVTAHYRAAVGFWRADGIFGSSGA